MTRSLPATPVFRIMALVRSYFAEPLIQLVANSERTFLRCCKCGLPGAFSHMISISAAYSLGWTPSKADGRVILRMMVGCSSRNCAFKSVFSCSPSCVRADRVALQFTMANPSATTQTSPCNWGFRREVSELGCCGGGGGQ